MFILGVIIGLLIAILIAIVEIKIYLKTLKTPVSYIQKTIEKSSNSFDIIKADTSKEDAKELAKTLNEKYD